MLQFEFPDLADREWLRPILSGSGNLGSEWAFGTLFVWKDTFHSKVCRRGDGVLSCFTEPRPAYNMPAPGGAPLSEAVELMVADAAERGRPFLLWGATPEQIGRLQKSFPGRFRFELDRNGSDYIYRAADLIALSGRKYHGKRNHIAQFDRKYDWSYEDVTDQNTEDCRAVARRWSEAHGNAGQDGFESEPKAMDRAFRNFSALGLAGGLIRVGGRPAAFTVGEEINPKTYLIHFEKALDGFDGLYAAINHEFAVRHFSSYEWVNREEDMGIEGLRKAKLSYRPAFLCEKYWVTLADRRGDAAP